MLPARLTLKIQYEWSVVPGTCRPNRSRKCWKIFARKMGETLITKGFGVDCRRISRGSGEILDEVSQLWYEFSEAQ